MVRNKTVGKKYSPLFHTLKKELPCIATARKVL